MTTYVNLNRRIRIWPNGTWQPTADEPYTWLSDDYEVHYIPIGTDPDDYVRAYHAEGYISDLQPSKR